MLEKLMTATLAITAACAVAYYGTPATKATPPAAPTVQAAPAPQVEVGLPPDHTIGAKPAQLTAEQILVLYFTHRAAIEASQPDSEESLRTQVETWLATHPQHDPRSPKYVPTPMPDLPAPVSAVSSACPCNGGCECVGCKCKGGECKLPKYTQPAPVAKPKAAAAPVVRYYYTTPRSTGNCSNGSCGSRRGFFGRRR